MDFSIWFLLWAVLSATLLYFLAWTMLILYRQKKAWKAYAKNKKLRYKASSFFSSPEISGVIDGYTVSLFTGEHQAAEARSARKLTAIEISLSSKMPFDGAAGSGGMLSIIKEMGFRDEVKPDFKGWDDEFLARSDEKEAMRAYLTDERLKGIVELMGLKNAWTIVAFRDGVSLLRLDTPYPLDEAGKVDRILKRMLVVAKTLELGKGESGVLKSATLEKPASEVSLSIDDNEDGSGLELED